MLTAKYYLFSNFKIIIMKIFFKYLSIFFGAISVFSLIVLVFIVQDEMFILESLFLASSTLCLLFGIARDLCDIKQVIGMQKNKQILLAVFQFLILYFFAILTLNFLFETEVLVIMLYVSHFVAALLFIVLVFLLTIWGAEAKQKAKTKKK